MKPLYSLRARRVNGIRQRFGIAGDKLIGALSYPVQIIEGQVWQAQVKFNHKGPAESIKIYVGPVCRGSWERAEVTMNVGGDVDFKEYESPVIVGVPMNGNGLGDNANVGTHLEIWDGATVTTMFAYDDSPSGTFKYRSS